MLTLNTNHLSSSENTEIVMPPQIWSLGEFFLPCACLRNTAFIKLCVCFQELKEKKQTEEAENGEEAAANGKTVRDPSCSSA